MQFAVKKTQTFALPSARDLENRWNLSSTEAEKFLASACGKLNIYRFSQKGTCANPVKKNTFFHNLAKAGTGTIQKLLGGFQNLDGYCLLPSKTLSRESAQYFNS